MNCMNFRKIVRFSSGVVREDDNISAIFLLAFSSLLIIPDLESAGFSFFSSYADDIGLLVIKFLLAFLVVGSWIVSKKRYQVLRKHPPEIPFFMWSSSLYRIALNLSLSCWFLCLIIYCAPASYWNWSPTELAVDFISAEDLLMISKDETIMCIPHWNIASFTATPYKRWLVMLFKLVSSEKWGTW